MEKSAKGEEEEEEDEEGVKEFEMRRWLILLLRRESGLRQEAQRWGE